MRPQKGKAGQGASQGPRQRLALGARREIFQFMIIPRPGSEAPRGPASNLAPLARILTSVYDLETS